MGGADVVSEYVDHGHVVTDLVRVRVRDRVRVRVRDHGHAVTDLLIRDRVRDRVDHGHVVTDLLEGRLVADTAGEAELVPVHGGGAVVEVRR